MQNFKVQQAFGGVPILSVSSCLKVKSASAYFKHILSQDTF